MVQLTGYCHFETTPEAGVYRCRWCGLTVVSPRFAGQQIHRLCDAVASLTDSPAPQGLGDTVHRLVRPLARLLHLENCGGCQQRRAWLNRRFPYQTETVEPLAADDAQAVVPWSLLLRFPHGVGDAVQLTTVLLHLRALRPAWQVDVAVRTGLESLFTGLCPHVYRLDDPAIAGRSRQHHFDRTLRWWEAETCYGGSPSTKAERSLREVFGIQPQKEYCRYQVQIGEADRRRAASYLESLQRPAVLIHYQGSSSRARKNLDERAVAALCHTVASLNCTPVILDWDGRSRISEPAVRLTRHHSIFAGHDGSGGLIAALAEQAAACFGIDSGPGHLFGATATPTVIVWTRHHPLHYYGLADNVLHLVPWRHERLLRGENAADGLAYFEQHYQHRTYRHLETSLVGIAQELLAKYAKPQAITSAVPAAAPGSQGEATDATDLIVDGDLWLRAAYRQADMTIVRDVYLEECYGVAQLPRSPRFVIDVGAHIGAFAAAVHRRSAKATIICVEPHRANLPALAANVNTFATIVPAAVSYEPGSLRLCSSIVPGSDNTGASFVEAERGPSSQAHRPSRSLPEACRPVESWQVPGTTLEALMREHHLPRVDLLKLDCEGCELSILEHADLSAVQHIVGEYHDRSAFLALVARRLANWNLRLLKDGPSGLFWLWQPQRVRTPVKHS